MELTHALFHADSLGVLDYHRGTVPLRPTETSLLVVTALLRAAGLEWGEQGDVWARVAASRPTAADLRQARVAHAVPALRRLLALDIDALIDDGPLTPLRPWFTDVRTNGQDLGNAARAGRLQLGLRSVLARHVLFHWNRMGLPTARQAATARAAREAVLGR